MSTLQIPNVSDECECSEVEEVVKLEINEDQLSNPQFIYETYEETDEDPINEDEVFENLPPRKQCINNEMVKFQTELRQHGLAGSLHRIIHAQQEKINPPMPNEVAQKEMATATTTTSVIKSETIHTPAGPVQCITPILIKAEPSEIHVTKIVDANKDELPAVPYHVSPNSMRTR